MSKEEFTSKQTRHPEIQKTILGKPFPELTSKSLAGRVVTLPEDAEGKVALIAVAFVRNAQGMLDSWIEPFERVFKKDSRFTVYEVPMIDAAWKLVSWVIDSGMRSGIPTEKHDNVITYYGDYSGYLQALGIEDTNLAYVFLLDPEGIIRWKGQKYAEPETEKALIETAKTLIKNR